MAQDAAQFMFLNPSLGQFSGSTLHQDSKHHLIANIAGTKGILKQY